MSNFHELIYIGCGGFLGAVSRYYVSGVTHRLFGNGFPYGTLAVNAAGSFLLGLITFLTLERELMSHNMRAAIAIGFLGAFTTFSTFSLETFKLLKDGSYHLSAMNIFTNLLLCLAMIFLGFYLGAMIEKAL